MSEVHARKNLIFLTGFMASGKSTIGPILANQFGLSAQAKYTFDLSQVPELKPHLEAGIGFLYANLDRPGPGNKDDTSFLIPLGVGLEYRLNPRLSLDTTAFFNFTDINVRNADRNFFFTWLVGVKLPF